MPQLHLALTVSPPADDNAYSVRSTAALRVKHINHPPSPTLSDNARKLPMKRSQKSRKSGLSIFFRPSLVLASTLTYSWVTGTRSLHDSNHRHTSTC